MKRKIEFEYLPNPKRLKGQGLTKDEKTTVKTLNLKFIPSNMISQILNVGRRSIDNILDSSTESNKTKQGRKKKTTDEEDCQKIIKVAKQFPRKGATQLVNVLKSKYDIDVSKRTFKRRVSKKCWRVLVMKSVSIF